MSEPPQFVADKSIVLVGLMGAGKTTIGRRLAGRLGLGFIDADSEIEKAAHCSIPDIFETHGETAFRDLERRVIARLLAQPPHVLATGGGAFMDPETRRLIAESSTSVWLRADIEILLKRVARRHTRPLLERGDRREILEALIAERYPVYGEADVIVDSLDAPHDVMVDTVIEALNRYFAEPVRASAAGAGA
ncbi:MAG: shikimate kinase [Rhodospirillaceae bacterium]|nr:shikimate kinase [Rhodospirillaceae bacterium]